MTSRKRIETWKKGSTKCLEELRSEREELLALIRETNREVKLSTRRLEDDDSGLELDDLPTVAEALLSDDPDAQFEALGDIEEILSSKYIESPVQPVIESNVVPRILEFLDCHDNERLQFEAVWLLTVLTSKSTPEQTRLLVEAQTLPKLVSVILSSQNDERVVDKAIMSLENIAKSSTGYSNIVHVGCIQALVKVLELSEDPTSQKSLRVLRSVLPALSNMCSPSALLPLLPIIRNMLSLEDNEVLKEYCWALSHITGNCLCIQGVIESGVYPQLVRLLDHKELSVLKPALRAVLNIARGNEEHIQALVVAGVLPYLKNLLTHSESEIRGTACCVITKVASGNRDQIQSLIDGSIISTLIHLLTTPDSAMKREAAWVISYVASGGSISQVDYMVTCGCLQPLSDCLEVVDDSVRFSALKAIGSILKTGQEQQMEGTTTNPYARVLEMTGAFPKVEKLQNKRHLFEPGDETWKVLDGVLEGARG